MDNDDVPVLFSSVNSWKPLRFMRVLDFLNTYEKPVIPPFEKLAFSDARKRFNIDDLDETPEG